MCFKEKRRVDMDKKTMVNMPLSPLQIAAGAELLLRTDTGGVNAKAAMWIRSEDQPEWRLLLGIQGLKKQGPRAIYTRLQFFLKKKPPLDGVTLSDIVLDDPGSLALQNMRMVIRTGTGISAIQLSNNMMNGERLPDAYIYRLL